MRLDHVFEVLDAIAATGCRYWVEGGVGVDALVGHLTRPHRDVDVDFDAAFEMQVIAALAQLGYTIETDWRPNRVELAAPGNRWVDLHPLMIIPSGDARQASLDGGWHYFPREWLTSGVLRGKRIPCVSAQAQQLFRRGYDLRQIDHHDLEQLDHLNDRQR